MEREEIAPEEQFLRLSTIFCYLMLDFYVKTGIRFSLRDRRLFEITEVEITRADCKCNAREAYIEFPSTDVYGTCSSTRYIQKFIVSKIL